MIVTHVPPGVQYAYGIFINSELSAFQQQPHLAVCFVEVPAASHRFLDYDSYAACTNVYTFQRYLLSAAHLEGSITPEIRRIIRQAALACPLLPRGHQKVFRDMDLG